MTQFTPDQWIIIGLVFVLGILVGLFMLSGRGKKWKTLYKEEVARREALEADYKASEQEWRERDSLRAAALKTGKAFFGLAPDTLETIYTWSPDELRRVTEEFGRARNESWNDVLQPKGLYVAMLTGVLGLLASLRLFGRRDLHG